MKDDRIGEVAATLAKVRIRAADLPLGQADPVAIAVITGADGPSYRPVGAAMVLAADGRLLGSLSSGCIDADVARHAAEVAASGTSRDLRYGAGSPFRDLVLPCGGGLDIRVIPAADEDMLAGIADALAARRPLSLWLGSRLTTVPAADADLFLQVDPDPRFAVFGKGPEALAFARMTAGAGYETHLASTDAETLELVAGSGIRGLHLAGPDPAARMPVDAFTAAVLFFHDHDLEPPILQSLLAGPAFYIGAQGSRRAAGERLRLLRELGVPEAQLARLRGPIGLIPSTRDARTLAASVLAEVLGEAMQGPARA